MNYYERHIGDYIKKTAHLSLLEHGIYTRLQDVYYDREAPLPQDKVARLIGARTEPETEALQVVLQEFFELQDGAWVNRRCDEEITAYAEGEPEREAKKANEGNRLKRHRQERAALFKALTDRGEHAPWNIGMEELRARVAALQVPAPETPTETQPATAPATPATATQTPIPNTHTTPSSLRSEGEGACAPPPPPAPAKRTKRELTTLATFLANCREQHVKPVPDDHPIRAWAADAGITDEMLQIAWVTFKERYTDDPQYRSKRYKDWAATFANSVKDSWFGLWRASAENGVQWSSKGLQRKQVLDARHAQRQQQEVADASA